MKKHEQIIILEDNEISMFVTQGMLASFEDSYTINYFTNTEETMAYLKGLNAASGSPVSLFVNVGIILYNEKFIQLAKDTLTSGPFRLFLLSSMPVAGEKKKHLLNAGFLCCIEKPLTEQKFLQALDNKLP